MAPKPEEVKAPASAPAPVPVKVVEEVKIQPQKETSGMSFAIPVQKPEQKVDPLNVKVQVGSNTSNEPLADDKPKSDQ